ncbi:hypothetical protein [Actinophytocola sediminis]
MPDQISARTWRDETDLRARRHLVFEDTDPGDRHALLSVYRDGDGPGVLLDPAQLREIAADLTARADLMERAR